MDGILLIDKPPDLTSFDIIFKLRKIFKIKRIGHAGTLDPFAVGLLVVGLNKATKCLQFIENEDKEYTATLQLGIQTFSGDLTGEVIKRLDVPLLTNDLIKEKLNSFLGKSFQIPPMLSAIKVNGKKLYEFARAGIEIKRTKREIDIKEIKLIEYDPTNNIITVKVVSSKGTYIRTLGEDIAESLNTCGHLIKLKRTRIGNLDLSNAYSLEDIEKGDFNVLNISDAINYEKYILKDESLIKAVKDGKRLVIPSDQKRLLIVDESSFPLAIYEQVKDNEYKSYRGLF